MAKTSWVRAARQSTKRQPKELLNWYVVLTTCIWAFSGVAKGFDEGNIASAVVMPVFRKMYHVDHESEAAYANTKGWLVSMATAGAVFGCLLCMPLTKSSGRKMVMLVGTVIYGAGIFGQTFSPGNLGALYASRFISGMGIGVTTVLPSIYISEVASKSIRGLLTLQYAACQQLGVVFGFFVNYGVSKHHSGVPLQYKLPTAMQLLPAAIWGIGICFTLESPRFLLSKNQRSHAFLVLARFRGLAPEHEFVQQEFQHMEAQLNHEMEVVAGTSSLDLIKETFGDVTNRRRFFLSFMCHLFSQWSGANAITQYSPTILGYLGLQGEDLKLLTTGIYGIVKFVSTLAVALFIIDTLGRRRSLLSGITLQILTLSFLAAYLGATNGMTASEIESNPNAKAASTASMVAIFLHAVAWSLGWFSIPYLLSAEIFPIRIRAFNGSILTAFHWAFYFGCSRAMPSLLQATERFGAFIFFAGICVCGLAFVYLAVPETAGRSLESMDQLFDRPWYTVHRIAYEKEEESQCGQNGGDADEKGRVEIETRVHDDRDKV